MLVSKHPWLGRQRVFFIKYHTSLSSLMFMMAEIISNIYIYIGRMIKWLCVCFWIHVIHTHKVWPHHHYHVSVCIWLCIMFMLSTYVYDLKKCVITLKVHNVKTFARSSKSLSWRQKHVMTSITRHNVKYTSKVRKVRHDVKTFVTKSKYDDAMTFVIT